MENEKFTPKGWHWKITPEQIEKIKERDRDTVNAVYFDNYDKFKRMAKRYCYDSKHRDYVEDCVQQIYVDIFDYDFTDCMRLYWSIKQSFYRAVGASKFITQSLDDIIGHDDSNSVLADIISVADTCEKENDNKEHERRALEIISAQTHLSGRDKDILTAFAFDCLCYVGLFDYEYRKACAA